MTREEAIARVKHQRDWANEVNRMFDVEAFDMAIKALEQEPTTKNDLGIDCIDRVELLKAMNTYDKFGNDSNERLIFLSTPALQDRYVPYVHFDEMVNCVKSMPSVTPQEPRWIPMARREPTVEEKREYLAQNGEELCYMFENEMPLNGQEVLVSVGEMVSEDVFDEDFYNFENNDIENVDAWMPLPKPYKEDKE